MVIMDFSYTTSHSGQRKLKDALDNSYMLHPAFSVVDKDYRSKSLFSALDSSDFKAILFGLGLDENSTKWICFNKLGDV